MNDAQYMYGSRMDRGWIGDGSRLETGWIEDGSVGWLAEQRPTPPSPPPGKKISQGWAQRRRLPLVSVGLDCRTCIERRLDCDCLDIFVGWLLIPTRRGVGGFQGMDIVTMPQTPPQSFQIDFA